MRMDLFYCLLLVSVSFIYQALGVCSVPLNDNHTIESYLCNTSQQLDPVISLLSNTTYIVSPGRFCLVENVTNLTIRGEDPSSPTIVKCLRNASSLVSRGFGFFEADNLVIENIKFENCGGLLTHDALRLSNDSTTYYFGSGSSAVLLCNHCTNFSIENVIITNYSGYAVIGCNLFGLSHFNQLSVTDNYIVEDESAKWTGNGISQGSGILLFFKSSKLVKEGNVLISNSNFVRNNIEQMLKLETLNCTDVVFDRFVAPADNPISFSMVTVSALTVIYSNHNFPALVNITNTLFVNNKGHCFGSVAVFFLSWSNLSFLDFANCTFRNNSPSIEKLLRGEHSFFGSDITTYMVFKKETTIVNCLSISDSNFYRDINLKIHTVPFLSISQLPGSKGGCQVNLTNLLSMSDSSFIHACNVELGGSVLHLDMLDLNLVGIHSYPGDIICKESSAVNGIMEFLNIQRVRLSGTHSNSCVFDNLISPVILATTSNLEFAGNITFKNNNGFVWIDGATVSLQANSYLFLTEPTNIVFENNSAVVGGAIYSSDMHVPFCTIQYFTEKYYTFENITNMNVQLTFSHNSASVAGNSVYISRLYHCSIQLSSLGVRLRSSELQYIYDSIFKFEKPVNNSLLEVSSRPYTACLCDESGNSSTLSCKDFDIPVVPTFPGMTLQFPIITVDHSYRPVFSTSFIKLIIKGENTLFDGKSSWRLEYGQEVIQILGTDCRHYNFTIFSEVAPTTGELVVLVEDSQNIFTISIDLQECPPGFDRSKRKDLCDCSKLLQNYPVTCDINTQMLSHPQFTWIGVTNDHENNETKRIGISNHCPLQYCHQSVESILVNDSSSSICLYNRTGILCGKCPLPLSTLISGDRCEECSNWYLLTIPLYALAGLIVVVIIFMLRLTVARGTINGLLFYANIVYINRKVFVGEYELSWLKFFILTLNLRLGFPLCLYDGMNAMHSSYLAYIFPMYLLFIELVIVLVSRYTNRISYLIARSASPVLATLFHFLYNYVLASAVDGLSLSELRFEGSNGTEHTRWVWYLDGNVDYLGRDHSILFTIILLTIVFFLIPYTILLTGINHFSKYRLVNYFRPLTDAYCAPYKDKWRFWFGARLWVLIAIYIIFALTRTNVMVLFLSQSIILATFSFMQLAISPFKDFMINILDTFLMTNGLLLSILALYSRDYVKLVPAGSGILVGSVFFIFVGIVLYHAWDVTGRKNLCICSKRVKRNSYRLIDNDGEEETNEENAGSDLVSEMPPAPTYQVLSYHPERLRESTLESNTSTV